MRLAEGIRSRGFRKWYEHELLVSHAHLVLAFVSAIGLFGALDSWLSMGSWNERSLHLLGALLCFGAAMWTLRRFLHLLASAETIARQASCPQCTTYGRLELVQSDATGSEVQVRCRKCSKHWHISA